MRLVEELANDDPRLPPWFAWFVRFVRSNYVGVGKLQYDGLLLCICRHAAETHFELWPAHRRLTGDASYPYVMARPIREGCDQCVDCGGLRIDMDKQ